VYSVTTARRNCRNLIDESIEVEEERGLRVRF
jgi:hypothetical protein